jgi:hypothetical protein
MSRLFRTSATSITLWTAILTVQAQTLLDLKSQGRNVDFSGAVATKPFRVGTTPPASCNVGEAFFKSDAPPGSNLYTCTATNTWTPQSGSGGSASLPSTTNLVKGNGSGGAAIASPGADYYKPGIVISSVDLPPNVATTDAQNTFSDPGNQYFGKYDVACDATGVSADNVLVKKAGAACVMLTTSDMGMSSGLVGLLISGSTTANGRVRKAGVGDCAAVGTINAGDWIIPSATTAGSCEGSSTRPSAGKVIIGRANGPSGATVPVDVQIDPNGNEGGSTMVIKTNGVNNGSQSIVNLKSGPNVTVTDDGSGGITIGSSSTATGSGIVGNHGEITVVVPANPTLVTMWTDTVPAIPANQCVSFSGFFANTTNNNTITVSATYGSSTFPVAAFGGAGSWVNGMLCADAAQANVRWISNDGHGTNTWNGSAYPASSTAAEPTSNAQAIVFSAVDSGGGDTLRVEGFHMRLNGGSAINGVTVSGTPAAGQVLTAISSTAAMWQASAGGGGVCTATLAAGANQIAGALAAGARICVTGNQTQNTNTIAVTQANVTIVCVPGTSIQQATASKALFTITSDNFQMEGCTLKPVSSGTASQLVKINGNHSKLTNVKFDISGSTATNGGTGWWRVTGGTDHQVIDSYVIASTDDAFFAAGDDAAVSGIVWRNVNCELSADGHYCFNTALGTKGVGIIGAFDNTCWTVGGCTHFVTNTGDYQLIGNKGYRTGSGSVNMFSNFAGVNAVYADNLCSDQGHAIGGPFTICFADHDSTGTAFHHNVAVMTGGAGNPFSFYDARGLDIDGNIAKGTIDTSTGLYSSGTFGWDAAQSCITVINQSTSADNSFNRIRSNTCYLPPSFSGKGINLACTLTGGLRCNDTKINGNILVGTGAGIGIEVDQADSNTVAGVDISDNRLISLATGIKTTGTISKLRVGANSWTTVTTPWSFSSNAKALLTDPFPVTFANLPANVLDGSQVYASDGNATCTAGSGTGRTCFRENGAWTH